MRDLKECPVPSLLEQHMSSPCAGGAVAREDSSNRGVTRVHVEGLVFQCPLGQDLSVSSCSVVSLPQASKDKNGRHTSQIFKNSLVFKYFIHFVQINLF